jgi:acetoin utilization deacetylase AcuC-like enzyme
MPSAPVQLGVVFFPAFDWAISPTHPEREERLLYTQDQLREEGLFDIPGVTEYRPELAAYEDIERVHFCLPDTPAVASASHLASAGGAIRAGRLVMDGREDKAFALVRPPGHHAMRVTHGNRGFCNVNIEAVMIECLRSHYGPLRVAVVDTDCHHGDGSQDIFWNDPDTLFISLHQDGRTLYPGSGFLRESGGPAALGRTINFALPPETGDEGYLYVIDNGVLPLLEDFKPDLIVNSAGQDNHFTDPLANMRLSAQGYAELNRRLSPHIAVLEGGYAIRGALPYTNLAICLALAGLPFGDIREPEWTPGSARQNPRVNDVLKRHCDDALRLFRDPPAEPEEGHEERGFWVRHKDVFYDTDMLHEKQKEAFRLCPHCPGFGLYESASTRTPLSLCVHVPRRACSTCREQAREYVDAGEKSGRYYAVLLNDQAE